MCVKGLSTVPLDIDHEEIIADHLMMLFSIVNKTLKHLTCLNFFINYFFLLIVYDRHG